LEDLSIRETAQILGVPNGTVKAQVARARKKLKQLMRQALRQGVPAVVAEFSDRSLQRRAGSLNARWLVC